jgi:hypothetical protein
MKLPDNISQGEFLNEHDNTRGKEKASGSEMCGEEREKPRISDVWGEFIKREAMEQAI